jgi:hypothetical protein
VEATYTNFLVTGEGQECAATSGSLELKYYAADAADAAEATKTVSCTAEGGALECTSEGAIVEVESPTCDPVDAK